MTYGWLPEHQPMIKKEDNDKDISNCVPKR